MLVSHMIARSEKGLKLQDISQLGRKPYQPLAFEVRLQIMQASKFVVPTELINLMVPYILAKEDKYWSDETQPDWENAIARYREFSKLPFDSVFLENMGGGYLVSRHPNAENAWIVRTVYNVDGVGAQLSPVRFAVYLNDVTEDNFTRTEILGDKWVGSVNATPPKDAELSKRIRQITIWNIAETLLFLNVRNTVTHFYRPGKNELKDIVKPLHRFYDYRVIDIYRERIKYQRLDEIVEFAQDNDRANKGKAHRAHMVRGHFKTKGGKLYWWNAFMRNRRNITTSGVVEKDYKLHT